MTKRLEEEFNLPPLEEVLGTNSHSETESTDITIQSVEDAISISEKINSALSEVRGMEAHDKEMDDIAAKVAELKVGDKTNFGVVVAKGSNSITFKAKDLPKTKITFNQRKMGSRDYVLSALRKA